MRPFRKNFWAFVGTVVVLVVGGAVLCGYLLGLAARLVLSSIISLPLSVFLHIAFGPKMERADRVGAVMLAIPFALFLLIMWLVAHFYG